MSLPLLPIKHPDQQTLVYLIAETINKILGGRANNVGTVTLAAGGTSTVVMDNLFESAMAAMLVPTTANAAVALATTYVSARDNGTFTLTHANTATIDRTFLYVRWG